ncbi:MAG: Uma2 family endonuclease [Gemmatimonadetes bacterium]|nr:Uma2 family endonuclease [Gemmatimonadota bacterium]
MQEGARVTTEGLLTAEDLERMSFPDKRVELVEGGLLVREPAGFRHGVVAANLLRLVAAHVEAHGLGVVLAAETGYVLRRRPDTVRDPDVSFVRSERIPDPPPVSFAEFAPDLAAEIVSPSNTRADIEARVRDLLAAGTRLMWVFDPDPETVTIYRPGRAPEVRTAEEFLDGEDVIPGFRCRIAEVFRRPSRT